MREEQGLTFSPPPVTLTQVLWQDRKELNFSQQFAVCKSRFAGKIPTKNDKQVFAFGVKKLRVFPPPGQWVNSDLGGLYPHRRAFSMDQIKTGITLCKAIMRNGYDAYAINAPLQKLIIEKTGIVDVDIACACDPDTLFKIFPNAEPYTDEGAMAILHEGDVTLRFYPTDVEDASHPERGQLRFTPRLMRLVQKLDEQYELPALRPSFTEQDGFKDFNDCGSVTFTGIPALTLSYNYLLAIRALRFAANFDLPVEPHTWMAIIQSANRILDYVPAREIMEEWRKVAAESMWKFVQLLFDANILHGLVPEIAALACVMQERNDDGEMENVFEHTIKCMRLYPEDGLSMDWYGVLATMFHDVGKLYTAEFHNGRWTFYQHHRVGAGVTRKILRRLHFSPEAIDLICHLVRHHMMFHFMLTDRGIRRFKALSETDRLIAICKADIKARDGSYTYFNHNQKYLNRAETAEIMLEPLLNGNEIMEHTGLSQGPAVGIIREALLQAQIAGKVTDMDSAVAFVKEYQLEK